MHHAFGSIDTETIARYLQHLFRIISANSNILVQMVTLIPGWYCK